MMQVYDIRKEVGMHMLVVQRLHRWHTCTFESQMDFGFAIITASSCIYFCIKHKYCLAYIAPFRCKLILAYFKEESFQSDCKGVSFLHMHLRNWLCPAVCGSSVL